MRTEKGGGHASIISFIGPSTSQIPAGAKHPTRCDPCFRFREETDEEGDRIVLRIVWRAVPSSDNLLGDLIQLVSLFIWRSCTGTDCLLFLLLASLLPQNSPHMFKRMTPKEAGQERRVEMYGLLRCLVLAWTLLVSCILVEW